jgi:hypothetical protein
LSTGLKLGCWDSSHEGRDRAYRRHSHKLKAHSFEDFLVILTAREAGKYGFTTCLGERESDLGG